VLRNQKFAVPGGAGEFENTPVSGVYTAISGHRYYRPSTERWLTGGPIGISGGANLHRFVGNSAVDGYEILGLEPPAFRRSAPRSLFAAGRTFGM
jgi:RHS repeat-associated protein